MIGKRVRKIKRENMIYFYSFICHKNWNEKAKQSLKFKLKGAGVSFFFFKSSSFSEFTNWYFFLLDRSPS